MVHVCGVMPRDHHLEVHYLPCICASPYVHLHMCISASESVVRTHTGVSARSCKAQISSRMPRAAVFCAPALHQRSEVRRHV